MVLNSGYWYYKQGDNPKNKNNQHTTKMNISEIRNTIDCLNWTRNDLTGGTREEKARINLPEGLASRIAAVEALQIAPRFARDIENKESALRSAGIVIERWEENKRNAPKPEISEYMKLRAAREAAEALPTNIIQFPTQ